MIMEHSDMLGERSLYSVLQAVFLSTPYFSFFLPYLKPTELAQQGLSSQHKLQHAPVDVR